MAEIIKTYRQDVKAVRFIGKKYGESDRAEGSFAAKWGEWFENGWFGVIENAAGGSIASVYEDGDAYIGLMRGGHNEPFEYWIGCFTPEGTGVPEGFACVDFPAGALGVCWIYGKESEVYFLEGQCGERLIKDGFDADSTWCFERYACPRFTTPDETGNIILDICFYLK